MRSLTLHLKVIITIFILLGLSIVSYQIFVLKTPLTESEVDNLWTIDAKISFEAPTPRAVTVELNIPQKEGEYNISHELFSASDDYGRTFITKPNNRAVIWSTRQVSGPQTLFYRFNINKRFADHNLVQTKGELWREPIVVSGPEKQAVDRLVKDIRSKSANVSTFITTTINTINDPQNSDAQFLLNNNNSLENRVKMIELILSNAYIPIQEVHTILLRKSVNETPELWIRSYIESNKNLDNRDRSSTSKGNWYYFNPNNGDVGLPDDQFIWWVGSENIAKIENGTKMRVNISVDKNELTAINLAKLATDGNSLNDYSFYTLPISTQLAYQIMLMIPFGVLIILLLRNVVGVSTLGTFTPVLVALAFRETGLVFGMVFFSIIVFFGLLLRSYLEYLKLQMLPRLSVVLTFVVMLIIFFGLFSHKLNFDRGLSITLFPMVILTMTIERLSVIWDERGADFALKVAIGTLITASICYGIMDYKPLIYFVFTFPAILFVLIGFMLMMGRYRGYRLLELFRFKALIK